MDTQQQKEKLREKLLAKRSSLSQSQYKRRSEQIINRLKQQPELINAECIHCYVSMNKRNEVNTHSLIKELLGMDKRIVVPVTNFESGTLSHHYLDNFENLKENKWGVLEPNEGKEASIDSLDLVIVPMAGGDINKNRIGYGKGFYDRFLQNIDCPTVGLLFDSCLVDRVPTEKFDVPLSKLITEEQVI